MLKDIQWEIDEAREEIANCKIELQNAKRIRKNRQEYDSLARVIETHPDRKQSQAETDQLKEEISNLEQTKLKLARKLDIRAKQLHALIHSVHVLQQILDDDDDDDEDDNNGGGDEDESAVGESSAQDDNDMDTV